MLYVFLFASFVLPLVVLTVMGTRLAAQGRPSDMRDDYTRGGGLMTTPELRRVGEYQSIQTR